MRRKQQKFARFLGPIILLILAFGLTISGFAYSRHLNKTRATIKPEDVTWKFDSATSMWLPNAPPPKCASLPFSHSPIDTRLVTAVFYPGQYRGQAYNANGSFEFDNASGNEVKVVLPFDAKLARLSSYIENGDPQYSLFFVNPCGLAVKFDHLLTPSPKFTKVIQKLRPSATVGAGSVPVIPPIKVKAGQLVATAVGIPSERNVGFDFGLYDLRAQNEISKNTIWTYYHQTFKSTEWFGVCWFNLLPKADAARVQNLLQADPTARSDYCQAPGGKTI